MEFRNKTMATLLVAIFLVSAIAIRIPKTIAKDDSLKEPKFRKSDNPLLYLPVDEEKWLPIVPLEPVGRPLDEDAEQDIEFLIYEVKTKKVKDIIKTKKSTVLKSPENQGLLPSELVPESVIPPDDRVRITPTTDYPWRTVVKLWMYFPSSGWFLGSGFIIDNYHVLTAGHCVYDPVAEEWATSVEVIPALDGGYVPFYHAWATSWVINSYWYYNGSYQDDFTILTLDRNVGSFTGWMGLEYADPSNSIYTGILNTAGYPGDLDGGWNMYLDSDWGAGADEYNHWYYMDTYGGQSGSPVWYFDGTSHWVLSVHAYGESSGWPGTNMGTRLSEYWFYFIDYVRGEDTPPTDYANLIDDGQAWSDFDPMSVVPGESYFSVWSDIRNIGTADSGIFYVSYYASIDAEITTSDYLIGVDEIASITPFTLADSDWSGTFPNIPDGTYYVGWIIDSTDIVSEPLDYGEDNNVAYKDSYQLTVESTSLHAHVLIDSGDYGDTIIVTGSGATVGGDVIIGWDSLGAWDGEKGVLNSTTAGGSGDFEVWFEVPSAIAGAHYLWLKDMETGDTFMYPEPFIVLPKLKLSPSSGLEGDKITLKGYGFDAEEDISPIEFEYSFGNQPLSTTPATPESDELGYWECTFNVPHNEYGHWWVNAFDEGTGPDIVMASALFEIGPVLIFDPDYGPVGTVVEIRGRGFTAGAVIDTGKVTFDGIVAKVTNYDTVDMDGEFQIEVVIPSVSEINEYDITVNDGIVQAQSDFEVTGLPYVNVEPNFGIQGATIIITGFNFTAIPGEEVTLEFWVADPFIFKSEGWDQYTDVYGEFNGSTKVPAIPPGNYILIAKQNDYNINASTLFTVGSITLELSLRDGPTGSKVLLKGTGFTSEGEWNASFGDITIFQQEFAQSNGTISGMFFVPTVEKGVHRVTATDISAGIIVTSEFEVTNKTILTVEPTSIPSDQWKHNVTFQGHYFSAEADTPLTFRISNLTHSWVLDVWQGHPTMFLPAVTNEDGSFVAWWEAPNASAINLGYYTINATDANGLFAQTTLKVIPKPEITILNMTPGWGNYEDVIIVRGAIKDGTNITLHWNSIQEWDGEFGLLNTTEEFPDGSYEIWFNVPEATNGNHTIWVKADYTGSSSHYPYLEEQADDPFVVVPKLKLSSSAGLTNDTITLRGYGYSGGVEISHIVIYIGC